MLKKMKTLLVTTALIAMTALSAQAFNAGVIGPTSLQNGYPVWWQDDAGFQVGLCLDAACTPDPLNAANPLSRQIDFGAEAFWWLADAPAPGCNALLVLAMEAAWDGLGDPAPGGQFPFGRIRVRADTTVGGIHTITTPFSTITVNADAGTRGINVSQDIFGLPVETPPFLGVLASDITHFFRTDAVLPAPGALFSGTGPIASAGPVNGSVFSITGPGCTTSTTSFTVAGRAFDGGPNIAPVAHADVVATTVATPVTINLTANDVDLISPTNVHGINLKAVGLGAVPPFVFEPGDAANTATRGMATSQGGRVAKNPEGTVTYRPAAAFSGIDTFSYVIQDTGGCISGQIDCSPAALGTPAPPAPAPALQPPVAALAIITVEQATALASFRPKVQKWDISGTSSIADLKATDAANNPILFTKLVGAQEVPPQVSAGSGDVSVTLRAGLDTLPGTADDLIDYSLTYTGLTGATQSHIHSGAFGVNGPPHVFLCSNTVGGTTPACPAAGGTVTGTLSAANFTAAGAVLDFPALIAAIQAGTTYVNVHTTAVASGEIRGQIGRNVVAAYAGPTTAAPVLGIMAIPPLTAQTSPWALPAKLDAVPSADRTVTIQTSAGSTLTVPLKLK